MIERGPSTVRVQTAAGDFLAHSQNGVPDNVTLSIRPEQMRIVRNGAAGTNRNRMTGASLSTTFLGEASEHVLRVKEQMVKVISAPPMFNVPSELTVEFDPEDVVVLTE